SVRYRLYSRFACRYDTPTFSLTSPRTTRFSTAPRSNSFRLIDVRSIPPSVRGNGEPRRGHFYPRLEGTLSTAYNRPDRPPRTGRSVLHDDPSRGQFVADRIGRREVAGTPRRGPGLEPFLDPGGELLVHRGGEVAGSEGDESEHGIDAVEGVLRGGGFGTGDRERAQLVETRVDVRHQVVEGGEGDARVEVVVHGVVEGRQGPGGGLVQPGNVVGAGVGGRGVGEQPLVRRVQPPHGLGGRLECLPGE